MRRHWFCQNQNSVKKIIAEWMTSRGRIDYVEYLKQGISITGIFKLFILFIKIKEFIVHLVPKASDFCLIS